MSDTDTQHTETAAPGPVELPEILTADASEWSGPAILWRLPAEWAEALRHIRGDQLQAVGRGVIDATRELITAERERMAEALPLLDAALEADPNILLRFARAARADSVEGDGAAAAGDASSQPPPPRTPSENGSGGEPEPLPGRASVGSRDAQVEAAILAQPQGIAVRELPGAVGCTRAALQGPLRRLLDAGKVVAHGQRTARRYYPPGTPDPQSPAPE